MSTRESRSEKLLASKRMAQYEMVPFSSMARMRSLNVSFISSSAATAASSSSCFSAMRRLYCWICACVFSISRRVISICWSMSDFCSTV